MRCPIALLVCALVTPVSGCSKAEPVPVGAQSNWDAKLAAADGIRQEKVKDDAMADLAEQAGFVGQWSVLVKALSNIRNRQTHDKAALASVSALVFNGRLDYARQIASKIRNSSIKDDALKQISRAW